MKTSLVKLLLVTVAFGVALPCLGQEFLGKSADAWERDLNSTIPKTRRHAAFALGKLGKHAASAVPTLKKIMREDHDARVREAAAYALGEIATHSLAAAQDEDLVVVLGEALTKDADPLVKRSAAFALGSLGNLATGARAVLEGALDPGEPPAVRQNAAWALGRIGVDSTKALRRALKDADPLVKRDAILSLGELGWEVAAPAVADIAACVGEGDPEIRRAAVAVLSRLAGPEDTAAAKALVPALKDADLEIRINTALALSNIGGEGAAPALPVLLEALRKGDLDTRRLAAAALRNLGEAAQPVVPQLIAALEDNDTQLRGYAALALGGIGKAAESAVPALLKLLSDAKETIDNRVQAAMALRNIGPVKSAVAAIPKLVEVLVNTETPNKVRERILFALRVHKEKLNDHPEVLAAFARVIAEPPSAESPMLRYDCAYMLGVLQGSQAPPLTLDVLLEFLKNDKIQIFTGQKVGVTGATSETGVGQVKAKEEGKGDGRIMAIQALGAIGAKVARRPDIVQQLQVLAKASDIDPEVRAKAKELLRELGK